MTPPLNTKPSLRIHYLNKRKNIAASLQNEAAQHACSIFSHHPLILSLLQKPNLIVAGYYPVSGELSPLPILSYLHQHGVKTCLPVVLQKNEPLSFCLWNTQTPLTKGLVTSIPEPTLYPETLCTPDIVFVPLVAYDKNGYRLGYGGGYYDRTLAKLSEKTITIGLGYGWQKHEPLPHESHDVILRFILTEKGLTEF
jgi:5-formyltetrahydrofolate cyclo-ligase